MDLSAVTALTVLLAGALLGLWALAANEDKVPLFDLLRLSGWYFVGPVLFLVALTHALPGFVALLYPLIILVEELLKRAAARQAQPNPSSMFYIVCLYGIWELAIAKSLMPLLDTEASGWQTFEVLLFLWFATLPVIMHAITAVVYAYYSGVTTKFGYWLCVAIHIVFNFSRDIYDLDNGIQNLSVGILILDTVVWLSLLAFAVVRARLAITGRPSEG